MRENVKELIAVQAAHRSLLRVLYSLIDLLPPDVREGVFRNLREDHPKVNVTVGNSPEEARDAADMRRICSGYRESFIRELDAAKKDSPAAVMPPAPVLN